MHPSARVICHGIDLTEVARIRKAVDEHGERFLSRVFTEGERVYCQSKKRADEHLAARFAAKEAAFKALGTGWSGGIAWTDAEVVNSPGGAPALRLHNAAEARAREVGVVRWYISLSHTATMAIASVIGTA